jgi:hypothetical protein
MAQEGESPKKRKLELLSLRVALQFTAARL